MTATSRADQIVAATMPHALYGLYTHLTDYPTLHAPLDVEIPGHAGKPITIWVRPEDADAWCTTGITLDGPWDAPAWGTSESITGTRHERTGALHGSCLRVRLLWTVPDIVNHEPCAGDAGHCDQTICYCTGSKFLGPCKGAVDMGCQHGRPLCDEHRTECPECRIDAGETDPEWSRC